MCILLLAIMLLEKAYKDDSGRLAVFGIEMIVLSLTTISLIYVDLMLSSRYSVILTSISYIFAIYYLIKSVVIYLKKRNIKSCGIATATYPNYYFQENGKKVRYAKVKVPIELK